MNPEVNDKPKAKSNQDAFSESEMETENEETEEGKARNFIGGPRFGVADSSVSSERSKNSRDYVRSERRITRKLKYT